VSEEPCSIDEYNTCPAPTNAPWAEGDRFDAGSIQWTASLDQKSPPIAMELQLVAHRAANGASGAISFFVAGDGRELAAKVSLASDRDWVLDVELNNFRAVHSVAGPHRNVVRVHGIANLFKDGSGRPALFLDKIYGPNGEGLRRALRTCEANGYISHAESRGAVQYVGKRLFSAAGHIGKAGVVHCDIKPDNYLLDVVTGDPIVVDLGIASKQGNFGLGSPDFCAPEQVQNILDAKETVDERTDVFGVASTVFALAEGGEGGRMKYWDGSPRDPKTGVFLDRTEEKREGRSVYRAGATVYGAGQATVDTAYTRFLFDTMAARKEDRPYATEALMTEFFDDPLTDDDTARDTLRRVATFAMTGSFPTRTARAASAEQTEGTPPRPVMTPAQKRAISGGRQTLRKPKPKLSAPTIEQNTVERLVTFYEGERRDSPPARKSSQTGPTSQYKTD
jgi:serine/threonine protein kinase